jgi:osmotically-inducible protein OsmY
MEDSLVDATNIDVDVKDNDLILSGTVNSRFEKHRAEALVENVSGVKEVQNNLRVQGEKATAPHTFG